MNRAKLPTHPVPCRRDARLGLRSWLTATILAGLTAIPVPLSGQQLDLESVFPSSLRWRGLGPNLGGRSLAAAGSVKRPNEYYFGAVGGGLWKTTDGGLNWTPVSDGWFKSASVGSIGICEQDPDVVYVGMGEGQWRGTMNAGDGAYGTRDGGKTWTFLGLGAETGQTAVARIRVHPEDCDLAYAAVLGDAYGPNETRGVYRTRDGGKTWQRILFRSDRAGASDLMLDPSRPSTIYATIWDAQRPPWGGRTSGTSGLFKSVDGGETWEELTKRPGIPETLIGKMGVSVSGADPNRVYLNIEADPDVAGVYRSDDGGATWTLMNNHNELSHRADYYIRIVADPQDRDVVHVLNKNWFKSTDGGRTYVEMQPPHGDNHDLWIDPTNNLRMIQANDGSANVSINGGETWTEQDIPTAQIYHTYITNDYPYLVCGAQQDNTSKCVPSEGSGDFWYQGAGGEQGYIAQHPSRTTLGYGGSQRGGITVFDRATGQRKEVDVWPRQEDGWVPASLPERWQWTFPIIMSPHDPEVIYTSSQHVWKSTDRGQSWNRISPDLTLADPETLRGSDFPIKDYLGGETYATVFSLAASPHEADVLWAGSDDGLIHVTRNGGGSWENVTPPGLPKYARTAMIAASPHLPGRAYVASHKYQVQDVEPYLFVTEDYGETWKKIVGGIPSGHYLRSITEDPIRAGLLYAGTEHGVYVSLDNGEAWSPLRLNLPDLPITDAEVAHEHDLVISTYGRGIYLLEGGATLIRQLTPQALAARFHLFDPADAVRTRSGPANGVDRAIAGRGRIPNTNRVDIYYHLGQTAPNVLVEVLDSSGGIIRSYSSENASRRTVINSVGQNVSGSAPPEPAVSTAEGIQRVSWDTRYPPAADFAGIRLRGANASGPQVPPGEYTVRVTADGQSQTQAVRVDKDPRLTDVTQEDLVAQFDLAMEVHKRFNDATSSVIRIRDLRVEVQDRVGRGDRQVKSEGDALAAALTDVEGEIYQFRAEAESDLKHFGTRLTNHLASIKATVMSADSRPTTQSYKVFEEISAELEVQLQRLDKIMNDDVERFNRLLREKNLPPIGPIVIS